MAGTVEVTAGRSSWCVRRSWQRACKGTERDVGAAWGYDLLGTGQRPVGASRRPLGTCMRGRGPWRGEALTVAVAWVDNSLLGLEVKHAGGEPCCLRVGAGGLRMGCWCT